MTQAAPLPYIHYVANGVQLEFPYPWRIGAATDLEVYRDTTLVTNYTVTNVGAAGGGNVVFTVAPTATSVIFIRRVTPLTQETDYINNDPFGAETHEWILDKLTRMHQDWQERFSRIPTLAATSGPAVRNLTLPVQANRVLGWNADGTALILYPPTAALLPTPSPWFNVKDYGAVGDGVTDDSAAIAQAVAGLELIGHGSILFPPGDYRMESRVTITDAYCALVGSGMEVSRIAVANSDGGFRYTAVDGGSEGTARMFSVQDLTILAEEEVPAIGVSRGTAIQASWPTPLLSPETRSCLITRVNIRSRGYVATTTTNAHWTKGIHLQNPSVWSITDCSIMQVGSQTGEMIHIDNAIEPQGSYAHTLRDVVINGGETAFYASGWMENLTLNQFEFVGAKYGIRAHGQSITGVAQPVLIIANGHVNASIDAINTVQWGWINIHHCYLLRYAAFPHVADPDGAIIRILNGNNVTISDNDMNNIADLSLIDQAIVLSSTDYFTITGNKISLSGSTIGGVVTGILIAGPCQHGVIANNILDGYVTPPQNAIAIASATPGLHECHTISGNRLNLWDNGIVLGSPVNFEIMGNRGVNVSPLIAHTGDWALDVILRDNHPHSGALVITGTSGSPSVAGAEDGLVILNQSAPTNISFLTGGYDGMLVEIEAANGNSTLIHSANLFLAGAANVTLTAGDIITLRRRDDTWREVSRTLL